jgi:hypothetical protein
MGLITFMKMGFSNMDFSSFSGELLNRNVVRTSKFIKLKHPFTNTCHENMIYIKWLPVIDLTGQGNYLGITETDTWVLSSSEGLKPIDNQDRFIAILSLLEKEYPSLIEELKLFEESINQEIDIISIFPFSEIVIAGLEHTGEYWTNLAINWIEYLDDTKQLMFIDVLNNTIDSPRLTQKTRHRIKKILKRLALIKNCNRKTKDTVSKNKQNTERGQTPLKDK